MPRSATMSTWVTRFQQVADLENDDSVSSTIWKWFASLVYGELWAEVSTGIGRHTETSTTISADGSASYAQPSGHLATVRVVRVDADGGEVPLYQLRQQDEAGLKGQTGEASHWAHVGSVIVLYPNPSSGSYKWYYVAQPTDLSSAADGDSVDVVCPAGEAFFVWGTVLLALQRQGKNVQLAMAEKERARADLQLWVAQRSIYEPAQSLPDHSDDDIIRRPTWERP